jgi:hypothetical protein
MSYRPGHPLSDRNGYVGEHRAVLYDRIGPGPHHCHWCGTEVNWMPGSGARRGALVVDHLDNDAFNNADANLVPACQPCNGTRGRRIGADETFITARSGRRFRAVQRTCLTCGAGFLAIKSHVAKGDGKFCSRACMYNRSSVDPALLPEPRRLRRARRADAAR